MLLDLLHPQGFVLVIIDCRIVLLHLGMYYAIKEVTGCQCYLLVLMHEGAKHEFANRVKVLDDQIHPQVHYGRDTLHNPPLDLAVDGLVLRLRWRLLPGGLLLHLLSGDVLLDLLANVEEHLQVLGDVLHDRVGVGEEEEVDRVDSIRDDVLIEGRRDQLADLREHPNDQAFKFHVLK